MTFTLDEVIPWGRSLPEYLSMFDLHPAELGRRILGCGDGPASFNAEMAARGRRVVSADPIYACDGEAIAARIEAVFETVLAGMRANRDAYLWAPGATPETVAAARLRTMRLFLEDYATGASEGRYIAAGLPHLPFADGSFDLALCGHLLFTYSDTLDLAFHLAAVRELKRVAGEVRVFPLLTLGGAPSPHVEPLLRGLAEEGWTVEVVEVPYEMQIGGNRMLRLVGQ